MKLTADQVLMLANALGGVAAAFNPGAAASIRGLVLIGTELNTLIQSVRDNDPEMWKRVSADFKASADAFAASVASKGNVTGG